MSVHIILIFEKHLNPKMKSSFFYVKLIQTLAGYIIVVKFK